MEQIKKLADSVKALEETYDAISKATDINTITKLDAKIGATLHSIQYGTGVCAIKIKQGVDLRRREIRTGVVKTQVETPAPVVEEEPVVEEKPKKKKSTRKKKSKK